MSLAASAERALEQVIAALPNGEVRTGQIEMARAVADAIDRDGAVIAQAGTGIGKSLAYLVPALLARKRTVVATATKALQDQLATKDLPFLEDHLGRPFTYAVLKGRSNYVCLQRTSEISSANVQLGLDGLAERAPAEELASLIDWSASASTGDRAELDFEPSPQRGAPCRSGCASARRASCPSGSSCWAERARAAAGEADLVVVNTHLYGAHLASGGVVIPEHDVLIIDEAHQLEEIISSTAGIDLGPGQLRALTRTIRAVLADDALVEDLARSAEQLADHLADDVGRRLRGGPDAQLADLLVLIHSRLDRAATGLRAIGDNVSDDVATRKLRATNATSALMEDILGVLEVGADDVAWIEGPETAASIRVAPIDVGETLAPLWVDQPCVVLCSATIPSNLASRIGLDDTVNIDVESPFDYEHHALLYCAAHLPDPRTPEAADAVHEELATLIDAAGGRTLALFTSWRAMRAAAEALEGTLPGRLLTQADLPKPALVEAFSGDEAASLFATLGFWQGIDVPGPSLSLVTIDKLPFPRPDEPLLQARRERARAEAFRAVDLPRATTLIAQAAGRLIRTATDRGVVAVLDPRLATKANYRWDFVNALPPMRRTRDLDEVTTLLASLAERGETAS